MGNEKNDQSLKLFIVSITFLDDLRSYPEANA